MFRYLSRQIDLTEYFNMARYHLVLFIYKYSINNCKRQTVRKDWAQNHGPKALSLWLPGCQRTVFV